LVNREVNKAGLADILGDMGETNVQGEDQKKLDVYANEQFINALRSGGECLAVASEENEDLIEIESPVSQNAKYVVCIDPLDGSSNIDVNVSVGSIFSVLRAPEGRAPKTEDFLVPGRHQLAAGYAIYGPSTMFVMTVGKGTHGFTLDREVGNFILTHPNMEVPADTSEFAINASNERFWEPPVQRYVAECKNGKTDVRGRDFNMRWIASMVADIHRILMRGGVFMYPRDTKDPSKAGRLRLMYEANPMSMVIEQAGGIGSTGRERILDLQPNDIHQRVPVVIGSRNEVERIEKYHQEYDSGTDEKYTSPLFQERSLYAN
jgi:fructose-1,6-bisphosphatase I/sedoheptulose-1,7-bisphosphatase/fructose-1,6-bisphosphatase I